MIPQDTNDGQEVHSYVIYVIELPEMTISGGESNIATHNKNYFNACFPLLSYLP